jgi:hypothetical protein
MSMSRSKAYLNQVIPANKRDRLDMSVGYIIKIANADLFRNFPVMVDFPYKDQDPNDNYYLSSLVPTIEAARAMYPNSKIVESVMLEESDINRIWFVELANPDGVEASEYTIESDIDTEVEVES